MQPELRNLELAQRRGSRVLCSPGLLGAEEEPHLTSKGAPTLGVDLRSVSRADQRDVGGVQQRDEAIERRRKTVWDESKRDGQLGVRRLAGGRLGRQPGILVAVEHQKTDARLGVFAHSRQSAEHHGAIAADEQDPVALIARAERRLSRGLDQLRERSLVEQPRRTTDARGILETEVTRVDHAEPSEPPSEVARAQDVDPASDAAGHAHRRIGNADQAPAHHVRKKITSDPWLTERRRPGRGVGRLR